jgi:hypothetical protein
MLFANAIRGDEQVDRLSYCVTALSQMPVMARGLDAERGIVKLDDLEFLQLGLNDRRFAIIAKTAQHLGEDQRRKAEALVIKMKIEPLTFGAGNAVQEIYPDGRVDDHHGYRGGRSNRISSRSPCQWTLPRNRRMPAWRRV